MANNSMLLGSGTDRFAMASVKSSLSSFGRLNIKGVAVALNMGEDSRPL